MTNYKQYIIDNWGQYKCKPFIIPLAGFFGHDVNSTFQDCLFLSTSANSGSIMSPSLNITSLMGDVLGDMGGALNSLRSGMSDIRGFFGSTLGSLTDRISNTILVVQKTIIKFEFNWFTITLKNVNSFKNFKLFASYIRPHSKYCLK